MLIALLGNIRKSFNQFLGQRNLRFPTIIDYWLFQHGCQIIVTIDAELSVKLIQSLLKINMLKPRFIMDFLTFCYCTDPLFRHRNGRLSC